MHNDTQEILNHTFSYEFVDDQQINIKVHNALVVAVFVYLYMPTGEETFLDVINGGKENPEQIRNGQYLVYREAASLAFIGAQQVLASAGTDALYGVDLAMLPRSGDIGDVPKPNQSVIIPPDSPRVLIGSGLVVGGYLVRYQYWHSTDDSYSLPPADTRTISVTTSSGMQSTTSDQQTVSQSVSSSASAGWGAISASISFSMNQSASHTSTYTVSEQTTRFESLTLNNQEKYPVLYLNWQLMDVIEIYATKDDVGVTAATIVSARVPKLYLGPYNLNELPPAPAIVVSTPVPAKLPLAQKHYLLPPAPGIGLLSRHATDIDDGR